MTNIFIDIPILLEHRSQVAKRVFFGYHLTIKSNIPLLCGSIEITLYVLYFRPTKPKTFYSKVRLHNSKFWSHCMSFFCYKDVATAVSSVKSRPFFCSLHFSITCLIKKIVSIVDLPGIKPNWFSVKLVTPLKHLLVCIQTQELI
jgi:hypothetical protein